MTAAREADVVVLALGGASLWFTGERTEGEASDTADITLPAAQVRLAEAVAATGTPIVVVLVQGRAYALPKVIQEAAAIVVAPYAGPFGIRSVAEVLFGAVNPSGKLPYSVPRHSGQIPVYHHQKAGSGYRNPLPPSVTQHYLDMAATPLWPFGHGLSYTTFALTDLDCGPDIGTDGTARISATVTNTGDRDGAVVVQLYLRVNTTGVTRPAQQLGGFARVRAGGGGAAARDLRGRRLAARLHQPCSRGRGRAGAGRRLRRIRLRRPVLEGSFEITGPPDWFPARSAHFCRPRPIGSAGMSPLPAPPIATTAAVALTPPPPHSVSGRPSLLGASVRDANRLCWHRARPRSADERS